MTQHKAQGAKVIHANEGRGSKESATELAQRLTKRADALRAAQPELSLAAAVHRALRAKEREPATAE